MKLLFCDSCWDIFKLEATLRSCKCGRCKGKYYADGHKAVTNGRGMCLALSNPSVIQAYDALFFKSEPTPSITCWARPHTGVDNPNTEVKEDL